MSYISYSQTTNQKQLTDLKPLLNIKDVWYPEKPAKNDTMFCFNVEKTRYIYQQLVSLDYCDITVEKQDSLISNLEKTNKVNNQIIDSLKSQIKTHEKIDSLHGDIITSKNEIIKIKDQQIKETKTNSTIKSVIILVITIIGVAILI